VQPFNLQDSLSVLRFRLALAPDKPWSMVLDCPDAALLHALYAAELVSGGHSSLGVFNL
jgi:hypothetical protein